MFAEGNYWHTEVEISQRTSRQWGRTQLRRGVRSRRMKRGGAGK